MIMLMTVVRTDLDDRHTVPCERMLTMIMLMTVVRAHLDDRHTVPCNKDESVSSLFRH